VIHAIFFDVAENEFGFDRCSKGSKQSGSPDHRHSPSSIHEYLWSYANAHEYDVFVAVEAAATREANLHITTHV
jgi:hypothetical protein